jgi:ABC-2 type transport system ATP-binding protein
MLECAPARPVTAEIPPGPALLRVAQLCRNHGTRKALSELSFEVARGEIFGFLGPNGAGKTTTFEVLAGLSPADSGHVYLDGRALSPLSFAYRVGLGVVFQRASLDGKLSARENLDLSASLYGMARPERERRSAHLLEVVGLLNRAGEPVEHLSEGMKRRLELIRALIHGPRLLVMDEPTQGLDEGSFQRLWKLLLSLRKSERLTILLATHRADEAERCDRLAVLCSGRLVTCGTPDALKSRVGGDVITVDAEDTPTLAAEIAGRFAVSPVLAEGKVVFESQRAHELIPRLVEAFPAGRLRSVAMRRPTLADAFLKLTGTSLSEASPALEKGEP